MDNQVATTTKKKRIFYFDALRALAIIAVVLFHATAFTVNNHYFVDLTPVLSLRWSFYQSIYSVTRIGVDLFLMLSGALSLGKLWEIKPFLKKRITRIVSPFLFWSIISFILFVLLIGFYPEINSLNWTFDSVFSILIYYYQFITEETICSYQLWFFWMIIGTYLIMPIYNKWLLNCSFGEIEYFLVIWFITCFCTTISFDIPIRISYFAQAIGCVILGYYLRYTPRKIFNNKYSGFLFIILGIVGLYFMAYFNACIGVIPFVTSRYSIFNVFIVIGFFILFKNFNKFNLNIYSPKKLVPIFKKSVFSLAKYSYGIYLVHVIILESFKLLFSSIFTVFQLWILAFLISLFGSWLIMALLNRIPYINRVIGAK